MKKLPRKRKHWAHEAFQALYNAIELFKENHTNPSDAEKMELITYAPLFVAVNRDMKDKEKLQQSQLHVIESTRVVLAHLEQQSEPVDHCFLFLMAYLNLHTYHGFITEKKSEEIVEYISKNYDESLTI